MEAIKRECDFKFFPLLPSLDIVRHSCRRETEHFRSERRTWNATRVKSSRGHYRLQLGASKMILIIVWNISDVKMSNICLFPLRCEGFAAFHSFLSLWMKHLWVLTRGEMKLWEIVALEIFLQIGLFTG